MSETFRIEPLNDEHDRTEFMSGAAALDRYFQTQASQDIRRRIATCFVAVSYDSGQIAGYYTLSATSIALDTLSPQLIKKLPRYPVVPAALLGRLAVARTQQGLGPRRRSARGCLEALRAGGDGGVRNGCRCRERSRATLLRASWLYASARREAVPVPPDRYRTPTSRLTLKYFPSVKDPSCGVPGTIGNDNELPRSEMASAVNDP